MTLQADIIAAGAGGTLTLSADYPVSSLSGLTFSPAVTIVGAGHSITGLKTTSCTGLIFSGVEFIASPTRIGVDIQSSHNITIDQGSVHGAAVDGGTGVNMRLSTFITISGNDIYNVGVGVQHLDCSDLTVSGNSIHDLRGDGIKGGGTSRVLIHGNTITDMFAQAGDHPDAIQFWTINTTVPTVDITITDNVLVRGSGSQFQGIFLGNEANIRYANLTITGNALFGTMINGIRSTGANNVLVDDNFVQDEVGGFGTIIFFSYVTGLTITNNTVTQAPATANCTNQTISGNTVIPAAPVGDVTDLNAWLALHSQGSVNPPVSPPPPPASPPAPAPTIGLAALAQSVQGASARRQSLVGQP